MVHANLLLAALSGLIGAIVMTIFRYLLRAAGQEIDLPWLIGSYFFDIEETTKIYVIGILLHLFIGACWGVLYVILLTGLALYPNWPAGIAWGFAHGIFIGVLLSTIADSHPYIGEGKPLSDPGLFGRRWSPLIPYWILALHVIFGVVTLLSYHWLIEWIVIT